jgi:hypothetical protein
MKTIVRRLLERLRERGWLKQRATSELAEHIKAFNRSRIYTAEL